MLFSLNITRIDEIIQPDFNVTLNAVLILPLENILVASLDHLNTTSTTEGNETRVTVFLDPLSNSSSVSLSFEGVVNEVIQLLGFIEYEADPTNGRMYIEPIKFPVILFNCSFSLTRTDNEQNSLEICDNLLTIRVISDMPVNITNYDGGDLVNLVLEITALSQLTMVTFVLDDVHPALLLIDHFISDGTTIYTDLVNIHSVGTHSTLLAGGITVEPDIMFVANITFRVQPYVLPQAHLFFSFKTYYYSDIFGEISLVQALHFFDEFQSSPVNLINMMFSLPQYAYEDRAEYAFPPHVGDIFEIEIQIEVPCVSTNLNFTLGLPEFMSMFFINVTNINISIPYNMIYISELCNYEDQLSFDSSSCDIENLIFVSDSPIITGIDELHFFFGTVTYNLTDCNLTSPTSNCECIEQKINVTLTGEVLSDMTCLDQTLADTITIDYKYSKESVTEEIIMDLDLNHTIIFADLLEEMIYPINASMPAISVPINSYAGDAGDSYNLTFSVHHDGEYSSFSAYDLNYTFSVNPHLDPEDHITICYYNSSDIAFSCEEHPFIDYRISRNGFHPV